MAKEFVKDVTSMDEDFAQWYTDVVTKADLIDYSSVRGSMIIRPYGYALWDNIKNELESFSTFPIHFQRVIFPPH